MKLYTLSYYALECLKIIDIGRNMLLKNNLAVIIYDKNCVYSIKFYYKLKVFRVQKSSVFVMLKSTDN
jgi:hypothetical protein